MRIDGIITLQWSGLLINFVCPDKIEKPQASPRREYIDTNVGSSIEQYLFFRKFLA